MPRQRAGDLCDQHSKEEDRFEDEDGEDNHSLMIGNTIIGLRNCEIKKIIIKERKENQWIGKEQSNKYSNEKKLQIFTTYNIARGSL